MRAGTTEAATISRYRGEYPTDISPTTIRITIECDIAWHIADLRRIASVANITDAVPIRISLIWIEGVGAVVRLIYPYVLRIKITDEVAIAIS